MTHSPPQRSSPLQDEDHFGEKIAAHLSAAASELPNDISERLQAARAKALAQRKIATSPPASSPAPEDGTRAQTAKSASILCCDEAVPA